jgi:hypothetical protein
LVGEERQVVRPDHPPSYAGSERTLFGSRSPCPQTMRGVPASRYNRTPVVDPARARA